VQVYEAGKAIAGMAQSFTDKRGVKYDFGAHLITNRLATALGVSERCYTVTHYDEAVYLNGKVYGFPFGLLRSPRLVASAMAARLRSLGKTNVTSAAESYRVTYGNRMAKDVAIPLLEKWSGVSADELSPAVIPPHVDRGVLNVLTLKISGRASGRA